MPEEQIRFTPYAVQLDGSNIVELMSTFHIGERAAYLTALHGAFMVIMPVLGAHAVDVISAEKFYDRYEFVWGKEWSEDERFNKIQPKR